MIAFIKAILYILAILLIAPMAYLFADWYQFIFTDTHFISMNDLGNKFTISLVSVIFSFMAFTTATHLPGD